MTQYIKPIQIGTLQLPSNIFYSPLAGCSDYPYRLMARHYEVGLTFCEMVKMDALIRNEPSTYQLLDYCAKMRPIGAQLCGSKKELAGPCAKIIEDLGFDIIDLNCGCPVDKITNDGSGSGLLKNPNLIGEIISNMVASVKIPITLKIRTGWDEDQIVAPEITKIAEEAGAKAISIHGRTREQKYTGKANWDRIRDAKKIAKKIKVIGNGDVFSAEDGLALFAHTGCDAILVSRGTFGKPWIASDIKSLDHGIPQVKQNIFEVLLIHMNYILACKDDKKAILDMRRMASWYLKDIKNAKDIKATLLKSKNLLEMKKIIESNV